MRKWIAAAALGLALPVVMTSASATAGSAQDPVVTLSYLKQNYQTEILDRAQTLAEARFQLLQQDFLSRLESLGGESGAFAGLYQSTTGLTALLTPASGAFEQKKLSKGNLLTGTPGSVFVLVSGSASVYAPEGGAVVDLTAGSECAGGAKLALNRQYMIADVGSIGIAVTSASAQVQMSPGCSVLTMASEGTGTAGYRAKYTKYAQALQKMGLFRGTNTGYELERPATRTEALIMLVRILGEEDAALAYQGSQPFGDVPSWADRYVAYAYAKGYTNGVSKTAFGAEEAASEAQYLTFLLRALGYSDSAGDFDWEQAPAKAVAVGMLTSAEEQSVQKVFYRDQMTFVSYKALYTAVKGSQDRLLDRLVACGAVDIDAAYEASVIAG